VQYYLNRRPVYPLINREGAVRRVIRVVYHTVQWFNEHYNLKLYSVDEPERG